MKIINPNSLKQELIVTLLMIPTIGVIILIGYFAVQYYGDKVGVSITIVLLLAIFPTLMIVGNIIQIIKFKTKNTNLDSLDSGTHEIVGRIKPIGKPTHNQLLCLIASYKITPVATDTFKDAIFPIIGIFAFTSHIFKNSGETPSSSDPIIIAVGGV